MEEGTLFAVMSFHSGWPLSISCLVMSQTLEGTHVELAADPTGRLQLTVTPSGGTSRRMTYQRIRFTGSPQAILTVSWSPNGLELRVNGVSIPPDAGPDIPAILVPSRERRSGPTDKLAIPTIDPSKTQDTVERFFLETVGDVYSKVVEGTWYSLIKAAGLLRLLLIDDTPLLHKVNRTHRRHLLFKVADYRMPPPVMPKYHWHNLDVSGFPDAKTIEVDLQTLLAAPCLTSAVGTASVKDLIAVCANAKGGVHLGKARTADQQTLIDWDDAIKFLGREPSTIAIAGLCRVVLTGITPVIDAIGSSA